MTTFIFAFLISYLYHGLGITLGYHRLLAHRSFKVPRWLEYLIISGGYLCFEGSPISWVTNHRLHHRFSDHDGDPHSPKDGLWHAFIGWMLKPRVDVSADESRVICADLYRDRLYVALDAGKTSMHALICLVLGVAFRGAIFLALGPMALAANLLASLFTFNAPLLVNSFGHIEKLGYRNFDTADSSQNVWYIALLALGEGWHNNHHALPQSARHGLKASEIDVSWIALALLEKLGLACEIRLPARQKLEEAGIVEVG